MPRKHKVGEVINGYRITRVFDPGAMAISYQAEAPDGSKIFLKQYKSPTVSVPWYSDYIDYQGELNKRIASSRAGTFCVRPRESFEASAPKSFWVAFEFVEGHDLEGLLAPDKAAGGAGKGARDTWENRVIWAKLLMAAIAEIHRARVVHTDLKPKNVHLIADPSIGVGYQLKVIDLDYSILADKPAPWLETSGYVGTDGYLSPEHFVPGMQPQEASDVFTCGLILYELLGQHGNPYPCDDRSEYQKLALTHGTGPPKFRGAFTSPTADSEVVARIIHRCLSPDAAARPTAEEVKLALNGKIRPAVAPMRGRAPARRSPPVEVGTSPTSVRFLGPSGKAITVRVRTELSKELLKGFGEDAKFWASPQCTIETDSAGGWRVVPNVSARNATVLNGKPLVAAAQLTTGDVLAVGNAKTGVFKLPLKVETV